VLELNLLALFGLALLALLLDLLFPGLLDSLLELGSPALLLLKEEYGLLLGGFYLLVEDLVFAVLHVPKDFCLALDEHLSGALLVVELLLLLVLLELLELILLACVLLYAFALFGLLDLLLSLLLDQVLVCLAEDLLLLEQLFLALLVLISLAVELFLDLAVDEFRLEHLILHALNVLHLERVELVVDDLGIRHLSTVLIYQLLLHLLVEGLHLGLVEFLPLLVEFVIVSLLPGPECFLEFSLCKYVRVEEFSLESLHLVLSVVGELVGSLDSLHSCLLLQLVLHGVDAPPLQFFFLQAIESLIFSLYAHGVHGVGPLSNAGLGFLLELHAFTLSCLIIIHF